jgi:hypothetical protein
VGLRGKNDIVSLLRKLTVTLSHGHLVERLYTNGITDLLGEADEPIACCLRRYNLGMKGTKMGF